MNEPYREKVSGTYGAPMGRTSDSPGNIEGAKLHLRRVPLVDGGCYDPGGAYWGAPNNLWCAWNDEVCFYLRAHTRAEAKQHLEGAHFYR